MPIHDEEYPIWYHWGVADGSQKEKRKKEKDKKGAERNHWLRLDGYTLQKTSDTAPSLSEAVSSASTFSNPFTTACCSSASIFSCICPNQDTDILNITIS